MAAFSATALREDPARTPRHGLEHARVARFRRIFEHHFGQAIREYGLDETEFPLQVVVAAVTSFQLGLIVEGLSGVEAGHRELLDWIQRWIDGLEAGKPEQ